MNRAPQFAPAPDLAYRFTGEELVCTECGCTTPHVSRPSHHPGCPAAAGIAGLTRREREVVAAIARGLTGKEIAGQLNLSPKTVETHRYNAMRHLGIKRTALLIRAAIEWEAQQRQTEAPPPQP